MRVEDVLNRKGAEVATIAPDSSVAELVRILAERRIGCLVVSVDGSTVAGIVSERDVVSAVASGVDLGATPVLSIMTNKVLTCEPNDGIESVARTMTDSRFRHMPVLNNGALAGIVSIGDIVKGRIDELETEREQLIGYINTAG